MDTRISFLHHRLIPLLQALPATTPPAWGQMNVQQMIEHLTDVVRHASGKLVVKEVVTPAEKIAGLQQFLMSDQPFPRGIQNPLLPAAPIPLRHASKEEAIEKLQAELAYFFEAAATEKEYVRLHPYFGQLDANLNLQALYKHVLHHLKQFGITV